MPEPDPVSPEQLRESLVACMDFAEDALLLRADQALSSASQNRYFEVLGDLRHQRRQLIDEFFICWEGLADDRWPGGDTASETGLHHARQALGLLDDLPYASDLDVPLVLHPRFRDALAEALSLQALRAEGQLSLLKAIEAQCPPITTAAETPELAAWLAALKQAGEVPADPQECLETLCGRLRPAGAEDLELTGQVAAFLRAWQNWLGGVSWSEPALAVLDTLRLPMAGAFLLSPDWFADDGCGVQLLADLGEVLPGLGAGAATHPPMVRRTLSTLCGHPERLPGVWLEWRIERERRADLVGEWLDSVEFDARHGARVREAQAQVLGLYQDRLAGVEWPEPCLRLLADGWSEVLALAFLHPDDTRRMGRREAIRLLDELLDSVRSDLDKARRREVMDGLAGLMRRLRAGLEQAGMDSERVNELLHDLRGVHAPLVFGRGDPDAIFRLRVDADWLRGAFPQVGAEPSDGGPEWPGPEAGDWIELGDPPAPGVSRYRVVHLFPEQDRVALFNELYVVFQAPALSSLRERLARGGATCRRAPAETPGAFRVEDDG